MFYVYVLESEKDQGLYVGFTSDFKRRLAEHNSGRNKSTKHGIPWKCVYCEMCTHEEDARRREGYLKTTQGRRMLKLRIRAYFKSKRGEQDKFSLPGYGN